MIPKMQCIINKLQKLMTMGGKISRTTRLNNKSQYDPDKQNLKKKIVDVDKKILDASGSVKKTDYNTKITEIEIKIPDNSDLVKLVLMQRLQRLETKYLILVD